jgi:hypothetical protein
LVALVFQDRGYGSHGLLPGSSQADHDPEGVSLPVRSLTRAGIITRDDARFAPPGANIDGALHNYPPRTVIPNRRLADDVWSATEGSEA